MNGFDFSIIGTMIAAMIAPLTQTPTPLDPIETVAVAEATYSSDVDSDCKIYNPFPKENEVYDWQGDCKDGYASGTGFYTIHVDGLLVEKASGNYVKGRLTGNGTLNRYDENSELLKTIKGEFSDGTYHGFNTITWTNGNVYEGEFNEGHQSGYGKLTIAAQNKALISKFEDDDVGNHINNDHDDKYVVEGIFKKNEFVFECKKAEC